jgi:hypothetical protein
MFEMKKIVTILFILLLSEANSQQSVGIGTTSPNASAALDINSTNKGILVPRMTTAQRNTIAAPAKGLLVFDSEHNSYWHYTGAGWKEIAGNAYNGDSTLIYGGGTPGSANMTASGQILTGNSGYIYDSGGPAGNYANNESSSVGIILVENQIALNVVVLTNSLESPYDSLVIADDYGNEYVLKGNMTGIFRLFGNVGFSFRSNFINTQAGFTIYWERILTGTDHHYDSNQLSGWYFNPAKLYMRGGFNVKNYWSPDSCGRFSFAYGTYSKAKGNSSFALGDYNIASATYSVAIGAGNRSEGYASLALGNATTASNLYAVSMGNFTDATGFGSLAAGNSTLASGTYSVAMGSNSTASGSVSFAMGSSNAASGSYATALGINNRSKGYGGTVVGLFNDTSDNAINSIFADNRIFQVGNGMSNSMRSNAITVLQNGNVGIGELDPDKNLVVGGSIRLDNNNTNNGNLGSNALYFGDRFTGEFISSQRTNLASNQWGLDFHTNSFSRMSISNTGTVTVWGNHVVQGNLTVQNGKGVVRSVNSTQQKIQSTIVNVNLTLGANSTTTIPYSWTESFSANPVAFIGNVAPGSAGGWAEVVSTLSTPSTIGGILYVFNPRSTSASMNFNLVIIGIGQ